MYMDGRKGIWVDGETIVSTDGWMDQWNDGYIDRLVYRLIICKLFNILYM